MDYILLEAESAATLEDKVNRRLTTGYTPLGGVSVVVHDIMVGNSTYLRSETIYTQAMCKSLQSIL